VDQQLASLLVSFWTTGDHDSARVLADRLTEMPAEDVAAALVRFRVMVQVTPAMFEPSTMLRPARVRTSVCRWPRICRCQRSMPA